MAKTEKELCTLMERVNDYWIGRIRKRGTAPGSGPLIFWEHGGV